MDDALKDFTTQLQMRMEEGISHIHSEQQAVQEELTAHRTDHARTHARVLEIQEEQHRVDHMIKEIHAEQKEISLKLTEAEQITLLKGLTTARLANGDNHDTCMKGTRSFILDEARSWMEDGNSPQIFWLADVAGSGKSTVANHLAREWKSGKRLGGRFFFSRDAEQTRTPIYFFTTIAQQGLSHLGPTVRATIVESIRELYDPVSAPLEDQCISLFVRPLEKISSPVVIVLDALDECEPITVTRLFHILIPQLANLHHLKLFLTSRPENYIMEILKNQTIHRVALTGNHGGNRADVKHFMGQKLRSIELPETQVDSLVKRSEGLFIWASTVCKLLQTFRGDRDKFIADLLVQGPRQMNAVYQVALQQALWSGYGEEANLEAYKKVLGVIVTAFEPLSPKSIDELLEIENSFDIVKDLQSVLDCPDYDAPVRFLHPTFREFLLDPLNGHPCQIGEESFHLNLAKMCLDFMARNLQWNLCNLPTKLSTDGLSNSRGNEDEIYWISGYDRTAWLSARNHSTDWGEYQQLRLDEYVSWVLQYS
ncbi:hypothetical protein CPB86DRAFT_361534 [Serendipita vermifera]|nr:hypothetical protein CPB86DRAFT_361534 [Serendipita vermifera]